MSDEVTRTSAPAGTPDPEAFSGAGRSPWSKTFGVAAIAAAAIGVILLAFSWPALTAEPRELAVAVSGSTKAVQQMETAIDAAGDGDTAPVELIEVDDRNAAVTAIEEREAVGALLLDPRSPEILVASAAGSGPQQLMDRLATTMQTQLPDAAQVSTTDVVPYSANDPTGMRLTVTAFPLVIGGVLGGALTGLLLTGTGRQLAAIGTYAVIGGFGLGALLHFWYDAAPGPYGLVALALALGLLAVGSVVLGLVRLIGTPGVALGAVFFVLGCNPISGAMVPREFLPGPWDAIGGWLPPGAGATLLRNVSYFPEAGTAAGWLILAGWAVVGLHLVLLSTLQRRLVVVTATAPAARSARPDAPTDSEETSRVTPQPAR